MGDRRAGLSSAEEESLLDEVPSEGGARLQPAVVVEAEAEMRLDRWFRSHFPKVGHAQLERWLRTGQVRIDGHRARAGDRLLSGQLVRVPPAAYATRCPGKGGSTRPTIGITPPPGEREARELAARVLHIDEHVLAIDKPAGLAVQGGTKTVRHLDGMLDALRFDGERPRLVHRLDRDTAGVLVLARSAWAASALTAAFGSRVVRKLYWAVVVGVPTKPSGRIEQPLAKRYGSLGERTTADDDGRPASTDYRVIERAGRRAAWVALEPRTGRTHQLRVHCALLGTPILGDGKYGGSAAFLDAADVGTGLHLHAREIRLPHPSGGDLTVTAPLPPHMRKTWQFFEFSEESAGDIEAAYRGVHPPPGSVRGPVTAPAREPGRPRRSRGHRT
jgi:23S rRNA pseudouridine955/2504/2580 synthase